MKPNLAPKKEWIFVQNINIIKHNSWQKLFFTNDRGTKLKLNTENKIWWHKNCVCDIIITS